MERAAEWYALVTCLVVGLSHVLQPKAWVEVFAALHRCGKPGAFFNGGLSLVPGAAIVAAHPVWSGPAVVLTIFGWLLVFKGALCLLVPNIALWGMARAGAGRGRKFVAGGLVMLVLVGVLGLGLWGS